LLKNRQKLAVYVRKLRFDGETGKILVYMVNIEIMAISELDVIWSGSLANSLHRSQILRDF